MSWLSDLFGGSSGQQQTQSTSVEPYDKSKPLINKALADAMKAYQGGYGSGIYTGSTVIPYSNQTSWGMSDLTKLADANNGKNNAFQTQLQNIMSGGGFNPQQQTALGRLQGASTQLNNWMGSLRNSGGLNAAQQGGLNSAKDALSGVQGYTDYLRQNGGLTKGQQNDVSAMRDATGTVSGLLNNLQKSGGLSGAQNDAMNYYKGIAGSKFDYSPDFQNVLNAGLQDAREGVNANASAAGRYGSGIAQGVMTRELGNLSNTARLGEYRDWQGRKDAANTNMANLGQTGIGNISNLSQLQSGLGGSAMQAAQQGTNNLSNLYGLQSNLANTVTGIGQQGVNNLQSGYGLQNTLNSSLFNAGQAGLSNMGAAYQTAQLPAQTLMQLGGMNEDLATRLKNDELRIFDSKNQSPWDQIGKLMQVANLGGAYTTENKTAQKPSANPFLQMAGGGLNALFGGY